MSDEYKCGDIVICLVMDQNDYVKKECVAELVKLRRNMASVRLIRVPTSGYPVAWFEKYVNIDSDRIKRKYCMWNKGGDAIDLT